MTVGSPRPVVHAALKELLARIGLWYVWFSSRYTEMCSAAILL